VAVSRAREVAVTKGTDNSSSANILPHVSTGGILGGTSAGYTQVALADGIGYQNLVSLAGSVDRAYYEAGAFMAHSTTETYLRSLEDSMSRPYFLSDPETGLLIITGNKLLYPNQAMPVYGTASAPLVLFGDFSKILNVVHNGLRFNVVSEDGNPNLNINTRELIISTRIGASAGISTAVKAFVSAAS
jgi:HK97 family phage major capsid protein